MLGVSGTSVLDAMGKPGDLGDCPGDKISVDSDQGLEIWEICWPDLLGLLCTFPFHTVS